MLLCSLEGILSIKVPAELVHPLVHPENWHKQVVCATFSEIFSHIMKNVAQN